MQLLLFDLQLQHDGIELHVQVVGSLQLPLVVLPDVQRMSASEVVSFRRDGFGLLLALLWEG